MIKNILFILVLTLSLQACVTVSPYATKPGEADSFVANKPAALQPYFRQLFEEGERNAVLNYNRLGLAALEAGNYDIAGKAFDQAIERIQTIYANNPEAEQARSLWNGETVKDFKGEPYERAMTYYYRGLIYVHDGDYDNARASFMAANLQDKWAEDQQYDADFGVMDFMAGWSAMCSGDNSGAQERFQYAQKEQPVGAFDALITKLPANLLVIDDGFGPAKANAGKYGEILTFQDRSPQAVVPGVVGVVNAGDTFFQATTRGGRAIDGINKGKANFKENAETVAVVAGGVAAVGATVGLVGAMSGNSSQSDAGAAIAVAGLIVAVAADASARAANPEADIRYWESLPKTIYIAQEPGIKPAAKTKKNKKAAVREQCSLKWEKKLPSTAVVATADLQPDVDYDEIRGPRNQQFRAQLSTLF